MKAKLILATFALATAAFAADPVSFERTYHVGDKDVYSMNMSMSGQMKMAIAMTSTQTVKKVYDNGDADIEVGTSDMTFNGNAMPSTANRTTTMRMTKYGVPVGNVGGGGGMNFARYANFYGNGGLELGKTVNIDTDDKENGTKVHGTVLLEAQEGSLYRIVGHLDVTTKETGDQPIHVDSTSWVAAGGKLDHSTSKITNIHMAQAPIDSIDLTMTRKS